MGTNHEMKAKQSRKGDYGMKKWKKMIIPTSNIVISTEKAVLVKMPRKSSYGGFMFWHPAKLIKEGNYLYSENLIYTDDFKFRLFKKSNGRFRKKIAEKTISAAEMEKVMSGLGLKKVATYEIHTPNFLEPIKSETLEELKDD